MSRCCWCRQAPRKLLRGSSSIWSEFAGEVVLKVSELENRGKSTSKFPAFLKKVCRLCVQSSCAFRGEKCRFSGTSVPPFSGWKLEGCPAPVGEGCVFQSLEYLSLPFFFCQVKVSTASWVFFVPEANGSWAFVSWMKEIKVVQRRLQVAISPLAEGRNLGLKKGDHQSLFHFSKLFRVEVACMAPTVLGEHSSFFTWVPLMFAKVVLFSFFLDPLHPFFTSSTCSVSQTQTQPEGCCRPVYRLRLLHPPGLLRKMRMLWGLGKCSSSSSSFDTSFKEVATWLILMKERDKCSFSRSLFSGWVQNLQNFFFLKNMCMIEILS